MTESTLKALPRVIDHPRGPALDATLREIGQSLTPAGRRKLGVELLHAHWPQADDEAIVGRTAGREHRTRVVSRSEVGGLSTTMYGVLAGGGLVPLQWDEDVVASAELDPDVVELGRFLEARGLHLTFAILVLSNQLMPGPDEVLLEDTDEEAREQLTVPMPWATVAEELIAAWSFANDGRAVPLRGCPANGANHGGSGGK